jgi:hypothetical protein
MLGRKMTVALGPKGNNLSLGGKLSQVSAEEAYTVRPRLKLKLGYPSQPMVAAFDDPGVRQGRGVRLSKRYSHAGEEVCECLKPRMARGLTDAGA